MGTRISDVFDHPWDVAIIGAGHNGLAAALYLARAGRSVVVLERRDRVGGACTLERPFSDERWLVSPCAYLVGLLHPLVIDELSLRRHGLRIVVADPHLWCPFDDGTSIALWDDRERSAAEVARLSPRDVDGYLRYSDLFTRIREALRSADPDRDTWLGDAPSRAELEERLGHDQEAIDVAFHASIAEVIEAHVHDERLITALHGQGIIGTFAGPRDPGTAAIHLHHSLGTLEGTGGAWGYVEGGMGRVSQALATAGREAGVEIVLDAPVAEILPGRGVRLDGGDLVRAGVTVSNADPKRTLALLDGEVPSSFRDRVAAWRTESAVVKVNCGLSALPPFAAAPESPVPHRAMVTISTGIDDTQAAFEACRRGEPAPAWCELYFHTAYDPSIAPPGRHAMSVFAQYAPYTLAKGDWESRRSEIGDAVIDAVARFAPTLPDLVVEREVLGPPDIEARIGLTGGHIFQGECTPDQLWDRRFGARTPVDGLYLCGAATHPGGSVIGANGRNAAMAVLADLACST